MHFGYARCKQKGFPSLILIIVFVVLVIIFLVPLPDYQSEDLLCAPYNNIESHEGACTKKGWHLGWPLRELIVNRLGFATRQEGDLRIVVPISPSPTLDETANWKTYTSQKKEFSFEYPYFWYSEAIPVYKDGPAVSSVNEEDVRFFKEGEETSRRTQRMAKGNEQLIVSVSSAQSFDDLKKSLNLNIPPILIQGKQALRYATGVYILLDPTQNRILSLYRPQYPDEGYLDKILSTFKFLDQSKTCTQDSDCPQGLVCVGRGPTQPSAEIPGVCLSQKQKQGAQ